MTRESILVTSALAYANGSLHLGHILEYIQTDIWVRFQRMMGRDCRYISGDDAHGTPIMLAASKLGITPEQLIGKYFVSHQQDAKGFQISFDYYGSTNSEDNRYFTELLYDRLQRKGDILAQEIAQAYDAQAGMFLPDRFVKGGCPRCKAADQYGDNCEHCGATYTPMELIDPRSVLSDTVPECRKSVHYFFQLNNYQQFLERWCSGRVGETLTNKLAEWFRQGLKSWDISRDAPYFGFAIPGVEDKYFYVWMDAPIGYISITKQMCQHFGLDFEQYWANDQRASARLYHFIGKDIVYFHALFWPAVLESGDMRKPDAIYTHGYLTINGQKMSKSRGTFILASRYLQYLEPEYLRYYFAAKLNGGCDDIDLNFDDFVQRNNSDLIGKVVNIASSCAGFITKNFACKLVDSLPSKEAAILQEGIKVSADVADFYQQRNYSAAVRSIMSLADRVNRYIDEVKPWNLIKFDAQEKQVQITATLGLNMYRQLAIMLKPILPRIAEQSEQWFREDQPWNWQSIDTPRLACVIAPFKPILQRVDPVKLQSMLGND